MNSETVNKKNIDGETMLIAAIEKSKPKIAETLIKNFEADVNVSYGNKGSSALHIACQKVNQKNIFGVSEEKQRDREDMVSLLLRHGANYNALNQKMETPVAYATQKQRELFNLDSCLSHTITYQTF